MKKLLLLGLLTPLIGCQEWLVITAYEQDRKVYFTNEEVIENCADKELFIHHISVVEDCENCDRWFVTRDTFPTFGDSTASQFPIEYGESIPDALVKVAAQDLKTGNYNVSAELSCLSSDDGFGATLIGAFHLTVKADGGLEVRNIEE